MSFSEGITCTAQILFFGGWEREPKHPTWRIIPVSKWLIPIGSPLTLVIPLPNGLNGLYMGVTNHLLTGMILQVGP